MTARKAAMIARRVGMTAHRAEQICRRVRSTPQRSQRRGTGERGCSAAAPVGARISLPARARLATTTNRETSCGCTSDLGLGVVLAASPPRTRSPRTRVHGRTERLFLDRHLPHRNGLNRPHPGPSPAHGRGVARSDGVRAFRRVRTGNAPRAERIFCPPLNVRGEGGKFCNSPGVWNIAAKPQGCML
jgi:hypothetical protein